MKRYTIILACAIIAFIFSSCGEGKTMKGEQPNVISQADIDSVSFMMGYSLGRQLKDGGFGPLEIDGIVKGIKAAGNDEKVEYSEFHRIVNGFLEKRREAIGQEMIEKSAQYLDKIEREPGIEKTDSGILYRVVNPGTGRNPSPLDTVEVNYEGKNTSGEIFDSSYERGHAALFPLTAVIKGWSEGMQLIGEGGTIELFIPAELAYGERGAGSGVAPNEAISFKVELISVRPYIQK